MIQQRYIFISVILLQVHAYRNQCCSLSSSTGIQKEWRSIMVSLNTQTKYHLMNHVVDVLESKSPQVVKIVQTKMAGNPDMLHAGTQYTHFELLRQVTILVNLLGNTKALEPQLRYYVLNNHIHQQDVQAVTDAITQIIQTFLSVTSLDESIWRPCITDVIKILHKVVTEIERTGYVYARCDIEASTGHHVQAIHGSITLEQGLSGGMTVIKGSISGFDTADTDIKHGFHIHMNGDLGNQCKDAGGHYNPHGAQHGGPTDEMRHVGDLGNIDEDDAGTVLIHKWDRRVTLTGPHSVINRAIVVHASTDDLGHGGHPDSKTTGHAGHRLGCCIITQTDSLD